MSLRRGVFRSLALALVAASALPALAGPDPFPDAQPGYDSITAANARAHIQVLASDAMQGREAATPQLDIAADYAAAVLALAGVEPAGDWIGRDDARARTYFQTFEVTEVTPKSQTLSLEVRDGDTFTRREFESNVDFTVSGTTSIERSAPLVFVGYGLKVPAANWDDYAGVDVKNKIVVALDGAPGEGKDASWFYKPENRRRYFGSFASIYKGMAAAEAGALALVVIGSPGANRPPLTRDLAENRPAKSSSMAKNVRNLPPRREMILAGDDAGMIHGGFEGVSTIRVTDRVARHLLEGAGETPATLQQKIDSSMSPHSIVLSNRKLTISVSVDARILSTRNVLGMIPGSDPALAGEAVMVGAHYDHDGARGGYVWYGADDNGSGTAGVLEIARAFAANRARPRRTVLFALWSAEEKGLLGSKYYVDHPSIAIEKTVAYINLDMIGRDGDPASGGDPHAAFEGKNPAAADAKAPKIDPANWMSVEGSIQFPSLRTITESMNGRVGLTLTYTPDAFRFASSDHLYFARRGVPIISYFDGGHEDYHQPTDTIDKINYPKIEKVSRLSYLTMWELANAPSRPAKVETPPAAAAAGDGAR
jgi:hypothetical protein